MIDYWYLWFYFIMVSFLGFVLIRDDGKGVVSKENINLERFIFYVSILVLVIFAGARGMNTGVDDWMYRGSFTELVAKVRTQSIIEIIHQFKYEPLTTFIMYIVSLLSSDADVFILAYAMISVSVNCYAFKKFSPLVLVSIAIYSSHLFINKEMNQIRFGLSSAFFILSVCYYSQGKTLITLVLQLIAILAHQTALAGCVMFLFTLIPMKKYLPFIIVLISIPLGFIGGKVIFGSIFPYLPPNVLNYEGGEFDTDMNIISLANLKNVVFIYLFCKLLYKNNSGYKKLDYYLLLTYTLGASIRITFHDFSIIGGRVGNLFLQAEPMLISLLVYKYRKYRYICASAVILIITYYYYYNTISNPQSILGYHVDGLFRIF